MLFTTTPLGACVIDAEQIGDTRGFFARVYDAKIFDKHGLESAIRQCNFSFSKNRGTLRGMHYQRAPYEEDKLVRCTMGAIYDVIVDARPDSKTYLKWEGYNLTSDNHRMLYVPKGFAHGFQTLQDNTEVFYQVSQYYAPDHEMGMRWDDPDLNISWPLAVSEISEKDKSWKSVAFSGMERYNAE